MSSRFDVAIDSINKHLKKRGLIIRLDYDGISSEAQQGSLYSYENKTRTLTIVVPDLKVRKKSLLLKIIRRVHDEGGLIWRETKDEALSSYIAYNANNSYKEILDFFSSIIPADDFIALKLAFFIRQQSDLRNNIQSYRADIRSKFGERGNTISNLCSAGYFEKEFKPLYLSGITRQDFNEYYERVVGEKTRALFVHSNMTEVEMEHEVNKMVDKAIRYHIDEFKIHGRGDINVQKILVFASSREGDEGYTMERVIYDPKIPFIEYSVIID